MMNAQQIVDGIMTLRTAYPSFYKNYGNAECMALAKTWTKHFGRFDGDDLDAVLQSWIARNNFPPSIKEMLDEFKAVEVERAVQARPVPWTQHTFEETLTC